MSLRLLQQMYEYIEVDLHFIPTREYSDDVLVEIYSHSKYI